MLSIYVHFLCNFIYFLLNIFDECTREMHISRVLQLGFFCLFSLTSMNTKST